MYSGGSLITTQPQKRDEDRPMIVSYFECECSSSVRRKNEVYGKGLS